MHRQPILDPVAYFAANSLHDAEIERICIDSVGQTVELVLDDVYAAFNNWSGMAPRKDPATLRLVGVTAALVDVVFIPTDPVLISSAAGIAVGLEFALEIDLQGTGGTLTQHGRRSIAIRFAAMAMQSETPLGPPPSRLTPAIDTQQE